MVKFMPATLIPPGISDPRAHDFVGALSASLSEFKTSRLIVQDACSVQAAFLPIMVIEAGLSAFMSPGLREELVRAMIADAPAIHAQTGTVQGVKRALAAAGISARWVQWFQEVPKAGHDTHKVVLFLADTLIDGRAPLDLENQQAAARIINATKRASQDITIQYGLRGQAQLRPGAALRRGRTVRIAAPRLGNAHFDIASGLGTGAYAIRKIRINARVN